LLQNHSQVTKQEPEQKHWQTVQTCKVGQLEAGYEQDLVLQHWLKKRQEGSRWQNQPKICTTACLWCLGSSWHTGLWSYHYWQHRTTSWGQPRAGDSMNGSSGIASSPLITGS